MNEFNFEIANEQRPLLDKLVNSVRPDFIYKLNRIINGYSVTLSAFGGIQKQLADFVELIQSNGIVL